MSRKRDIKEWQIRMANINAKAVNSGKPWTEREVKIATAFVLGYTDKYLSIEDIALKLGRTYGSVAVVQSKARWARRFQGVLYAPHG